MRRAILVLTVLLLAGCGGASPSALDCDETRTVDVEPPPRFGGDAAAIAAWYLEGKGLTGSDVLVDAPSGDEPAVLVRRDGRVVGKVTVEDEGTTASVETCADFAA